MYYTMTDIARRLHVDYFKINKLVQRGRLPKAVKTGRHYVYTEEDMEHFRAYFEAATRETKAEAEELLAHLVRK